MKINNHNYFEKYLKLRDEINEVSDKLFDKHSKNLQCKKGCDKCFEGYKVFWVWHIYNVCNLPNIVFRI